MTHDERKSHLNKVALVERIEGYRAYADELASERDALAGKVKVEMDRAEASYSCGWSDRAAKDESAVLRGRIAELEEALDNEHCDLVTAKDRIAELEREVEELRAQCRCQHPRAYGHTGGTTCPDCGARL